MARILNAADPGFAADFGRLIAASREERADVDGAVAGILADVKARGDAAVLDYTAKWDRVALTPATLRFTDAELSAAEKACDAETLSAVVTAAERIADYHRRQLPRDELYTDAAGITLGWRWTAVSSAGLYVPGGTAALFSSVLMNAVPAKVAGVKRVVVTLPTPDGKTNPLMLAACRIAGVDEVFCVGGAQAIAALAYGTGSIAPVDKIVGPGNAYVASAKKQVFGTVGIDMVAGPSEVTVVADAANDPDWIAADLLAQAEHDASSQSILITDDMFFAGRVAEAVTAQLATLPRAAIARDSWQRHGGIVVVRNLSDAAALVDQIAPEHLELAVTDPQPLMAAITHAGAIFIGRYTPEAAGDYIAGPSHVLPTSGTARFSSGLGVFDFLKRTSIIDCTPQGLRAIGPAAVRMAEAEGLAAHARSVSIRLNVGRG
ncbi:MAG: histidinol dehydrogenase [Rhodospirillaceae bacterium]|nr:histidinol dehydrogenase [Rhodospirillaceae bacterium]